MSLTIGGGRRVGLDEVAKFAVLKQKIAFDLPTLQKIDDKFTASKKQFVSVNTINFISTEDEKQCPVNIVRAGLFCRIVSLLQGNANVRTTTIKLLADSLNADITPVLNNHNCGSNLSAFLNGKGLCVNANNQTVTTEEAFSAAGLNATSLSQDEVNTFSAYPFIAIGTGCLLAVASQTLLKSIDSITSLSCEVVGVNTAAFDGANFEVSRQHRGQMQSAANLRLLLEGSKGVNKELISLEQALQFRGLPQITGPCQEAIAVAVK
jgi:histidine ammonia-lyase